MIALFLPRVGAVSAQGNQGYRFADCELDPHEHRLFVHGRPVTLTPKVFETLVLLVERAGHVISKDELMAALWPRGFVHESNLTKHIWLIRRALGDEGDDGHCIETVPKLGYRFIAPVQRIAHPADLAESMQAFEAVRLAAPIALLEKNEAVSGDDQTAERNPERRRGSDLEAALLRDGVHAPAAVPSIRHGDRIWLTAIAVVLIAVIAGLYLWRVLPATTSRISSAPDAGAVAIVDFNNLSGNAKDAWLGPALQQMLATEVAAGGNLHAVPEELVRPAHSDLSAPDAGGYAPASLALLRRRLGAHYILSGAYLVSGVADAPQLRIDLSMQDAQTGHMVASLSRIDAVSDLPRMIAQAGGDLRASFGVRLFDAVALRQTANSQPPTTEVARHIGFALDALNGYDAARARDELLQAIAQAPGYAPAYMYLARAWSMLGYRAKALAASRQALENANDLPTEQQLQIKAQQFELQGDHVRASQVWRELMALRPSNPEYQLRLIDALVNAGKYADAQAALVAARKLAGTIGDPRIELAAADIATLGDDSRSTISHARLALQQAQSRGENVLAAEAELRLGVALAQDSHAEPLLRRAVADFHAIGNPHGEALAMQNLGNLQSARNQIDAARETYQRAMTIYQGIGDLGGEAAIYDNLSDMLWSAGDRDGTEAALRQALAIARETADPARQAWTLTGLATVLSDESASDDVAAMYQQAIALDAQSGTRAHGIFAQSTYADLLRMRGELDSARKVCMRAQTEAHELNDAMEHTIVDFECAQIALDRGEADSAAAVFSNLEKTAIARKDTFQTANAQLMLGQIAMGRQRWSDARNALQKSLAGWTASKEVPGEATAEALLALCDAALGDAPARDAASANARDLRGRITQRAEAFQLDIALAELQGADGKSDEAIGALHALANDAAQRHWIGLAFEARLAAQRVLERGADHAMTRASRVALDADARGAGFGWVDQRLAMMTPARPR